jgi:hypothetical protein
MREKDCAKKRIHKYQKNNVNDIGEELDFD